MRVGEVDKDWDLDLQPCLEQRCDPVISCLLAEEVRFLIVGSWAVRFYGHADRKVGDLDLLVEFSAENWPRLTIALHRLGVLSGQFDQTGAGTKAVPI
jgi:hypothetical protein